jgi:hypothetical protein
MECGTHDLLVENKDLVHADEGVVEACSDTGLGIKMVVDLLDEEGFENFLVEVGSGPDPIHLKEGFGEEDRELLSVLALHVMQPVGEFVNNLHLFYYYRCWGLVIMRYKIKDSRFHGEIEGK